MGRRDPRDVNRVRRGGSPIDMERTTKLAVVIGAAGLLAFELAIGRAWSGMQLIASALFLATAALTAYDRRSIGLVLAASCVFPAVIRLTLETYATQFDVLWMAALFGAIVPDALTSRWHIPRTWRAPLVLAAYAVLAGTTITIARELDFNLGLLNPPPEAILSGLPRYFAEWVAQVGLTLVLGILWFDWLMGAADVDLESSVLLPFGASLVVLALVSVYQLFGDISFLNETAYAQIGRAAGTMYDANVSGTLAAMGIGGALYASDRYPGWRRGVAIVGVVLLSVAVWASGSRTATGAAVIVFSSSALAFWRSRRMPGSRVKLDAWTVVAGAAAVGVMIVAALTVNTTAVGPFGRLWAMLPSVSGMSVREVAAELWNRNGYGAAATYLIERFPLSGVGIGGFHMFGPQLSPVGTLPPDNAQNWFRHQLVEMGVLGACGWLIFAALFGWFMLARNRAMTPSAGHARGIVLAIGVVSLLGMPTQHVVAAVAFWTAACWYVRMAGIVDDPRPVKGVTWLALAAVLVAFAASTLQAAMTDLRVPMRAAHMGWPYSYGFYAPEPDGEGGEVRWTAGRASALIDVRGQLMHLAVRVPHSDLATNPVGVKVWSSGRLVIDTRLVSGDPVLASVPILAGARQTLLDVRVSRTVRPRDSGVADDRDLGVLVKWDFSSRP